MGQARQRGAYDDRKAQAIARRQDEEMRWRIAQAEIASRRESPKLHRTRLQVASILGSALGATLSANDLLSRVPAERGDSNGN